MDEIRSLAKEGQALLEQARTQTSGRSSSSLVHSDRQRAVLIALTSGSGLSEHDSPPAATLQVVSGRARLYVADDGPEWLLDEGDLVPIPQERHGVDALSDTVLLLTVSL
ncbi:MAG: hypothetical protein Q4G67_14040 [Actinomycetia bacterium]|nr:hypothetical protein [Actinomycetes bacterium]